MGKIKIENTITNQTIKGIGGDYKPYKGKVYVGRKNSTQYCNNYENDSKTNRQGEAVA